jgi:hypothetical protein
MSVVPSIRDAMPNSRARPADGDADLGVYLHEISAEIELNGVTVLDPIILTNR